VKLYDSKLSGNTYKVRLLLSHLGLDYERVEIDVMDQTERKRRLHALNPTGRVPILELGDGRVLPESNAILCYLAEGTPYLPDERFARATVLRWMFFEQNHVEPNLGAARVILTLLGKADEHREMLAMRQQAAIDALDALERGLDGRAFLVGESYTIADLALYGYTHLAPEAGVDLARYPEIRAWLGRVEKQPGFVPMGGKGHSCHSAR